MYTIAIQIGERHISPPPNRRKRKSKYLPSCRIFDFSFSKSGRFLLKHPAEKHDSDSGVYPERVALRDVKWPVAQMRQTMKLLFDELVSTWTGGGLSLPLCRPHWESDEFAQYTPDARATMLIVCQTTRNYHPSDIYPRCINDSYARVYRCYTPVKIALDGPAVVCSSYLNTQPSIFSCSISGLSRSVLIFSRGFEQIARNLSRFKVSRVTAILRSLPFDSHRWRSKAPFSQGWEREREVSSLFRSGSWTESTGGIAP